ncbi:MAG: DMT family transporter [Desulfobacteraceae bacterium]|nr:DMT family transporter [Desulfobacteraceae bacterium]
MKIVLATAIGAVITMMIMFNSVLAVKTGQVFANIVIHLVGLAAASLLIPVLEKKHINEKPPLYLYVGGVCGFFIVVSNNVCFAVLGASLTLSLGIMGQCLGSVIADSMGFLGMTRHPFHHRRLVGFGIILMGILFMIEQWRVNAFYIAIAVLTGMLVVVTMVVNAQLALRIGVFRGTRINYITGLGTVALFALAGGVDVTGSFTLLASLHPLYIFGGGICGVTAVVGINYILPRIPVIYGTLLFFLGQVVAGLVIDYLFYRTLSPRRLLGAVIVLSGLAMNMLADRAATPKRKRCSPGSS